MTEKPEFVQSNSVLHSDRTRLVYQTYGRRDRNGELYLLLRVVGSISEDGTRYRGNCHYSTHREWQYGADLEPVDISGFTCGSWLDGSPNTPTCGLPAVPDHRWHSTACGRVRWDMVDIEVTP
jgi:hypothetical protein